MPTYQMENDHSRSIDEESGLLRDEERQPKRKDWKYWLIWFWRFCIFGVTGSSSVKVTSYFLTHLAHSQVGTWYYYVIFFFVELVIYTILIILLGSLLGQWRFFCLVAFKMWSWLLPAKIKIWCHEYLSSYTITV